jgi:hypothetical protein
MSKNEQGSRGTPISDARTPEEVGEFWDAHSLADHWDQTRDAQFDVRALRRRRVTLDPQVYTEIEAQAKVRGLSPETLVNLWLAERLHQA